MSHNLDTLFPAIDDIPEAWRPDAPVEQRDYLVNGQLRRWDGPLAPVRSPIFLKTAEGESQVILGSTPLLDADAALAALDAAVAAYDNGQGLWPNLRVAERIQHVETFLARMREQREAVVRLLMWEIGKNLKHSEKEFDRTCDYIVDTIEALKELDRRSSRFELEQGTLGQIRRVPLGVALEPGLGLLIDKDPVKVYPYRTCNSVGCIAVADFDDKLASALDKAEDVKIALAGLDGRQQQIAVSLKGFHQARSAYKSTEAHRHNWFWRLWS